MTIEADIDKRFQNLLADPDVGADPRALKWATSDRIRADIVEITPEQAEKWLTLNLHNRRLNQERALFLADQMRNGEWRTTSQGIGFASNGVLVDGQTRLTAIMLSGVTVECVVVRGLPSEAQLRIDVGKSRTLTDAFRLMGYSYAASLGPLTKAVIGLTVYLPLFGLPRDVTHQHSFSIPATLNFFEERKERLLEVAPLTQDMPNRASIPGTAFAAVYYVLLEAERGLAEQFMEQCKWGLNLERYDPPYVLRETFKGFNTPTRTNRDGLSRKKLQQVESMGAIIEAWNAFLAKTPLKSLSTRPIYGKLRAFPEIAGWNPDFEGATRLLGLNKEEF